MPGYIYIPVTLFWPLFYKNDSSFTAQTVVTMITVVKKKKKKKRKKYIGSARFDPGTVTSYLKTLPQGNEWPNEKIFL